VKEKVKLNNYKQVQRDIVSFSSDQIGAVLDWTVKSY